MHLGFIEMNMAFFNREKEKRICFAIMLISVNCIAFTQKCSDIHHYENSYNNDCHDAVSAG